MLKNEQYLCLAGPTTTPLHTPHTPTRVDNHLYRPKIQEHRSYGSAFYKRILDMSLPFDKIHTYTRNTALKTLVTLSEPNEILSVWLNY